MNKTKQFHQLIEAAFADRTAGGVDEIRRVALSPLYLQAAMSRCRFGS